MRKAFIIPVCLLILSGEVASLLAQTDPVLEEKWKNGFLASGTYGGGNISVNLHNGGLIATIPILTLPGRAGHNLSITASYNSKQLVRRWLSLNTYRADFFNDGPTAGRWVVNVWPSLKVVSPGPYNGVFMFTTPDGAVHRLSRYQTGEIYYAEDGSNIRYSVGDQQVQFPNGEVFDFSAYVSPDYKVYHRDRNGNQITYYFEVDGGGRARPIRITDTLGREVFIRYVNSPDYWTITSVAAKNQAGVEKSWAFGYTNTYYVRPITGTNYYNCQYNGVPYYPWLLQTLTLPNNTTYQFTYNTDSVLADPGVYQNLSTLQLATMTAPTGAVTTCTYATPWNGTTDEKYNFRLDHPIYTIAVDPLGGGAFTTTYTYTIDTAGFVTRTTETRADGSKHIVDWNPSTSTDKFLRQVEYVTDTDGTTNLQSVSTSWTTLTAGKFAGTGTTSYYNAGVLTANAKLEQTYDSWGNATDSRYYENNYLLAHTTRQFDVAYLTSWYFTKPTKEEQARLHYNCSTYIWDEVVTNSASFLYDEFALTDRGTVTGQASGYGPSRTTRGNLTSLKRYLVSEDRDLLTKSYYDTVGNVVQVTDPLNHSTTTAYSGTFSYAYPTSLTNAKAQVVQTNYELNTGVVLSVTDPNNQTTSFQYDAYNRKTRETYPDTGWTSWTYNDTYNTGAYRMTVKTERSVTATNKSTVTEYLDGLGRVLRTETTEPGTSKAFVDRQYALCSCTGKTSKVSTPYRSGQTVYWTETQFDGLGRVRKVIPPDGTSSSNYTEYRYRVEKPIVYDCGGANAYYATRLMFGVFDAKGIGRVQSYDAEGSLRQVREDAASDFSSSYVTDYGPWYDTNYVIKGTVKYTPYSYPSIGQGSQTRWQQVDSLGRLRTDRHPENETTSLTYDDAGNVRTKTDYRGIVTTTNYDEINRPTGVTFSDSTPAITYTYDTGSYGIGRLRSVSNSTASSTYTYNNMGQVTREDKTINGVAFYTTNVYNLAGAVTTTRLPNGTTLTNNFDTVGRLSSLTSSWSDSNHPATLASSFVYHASQAVTQVDFGNGTRMIRGFNSGMQLKTLQHGAIGTPGSLLNLEYNYQETVSNNGRIMGITDYNDRTKDLTFTYDRLYRLQTAETAGTHWGLSWTHDRYGNRLTQSVTKGTGPTSSLTYSDTTNKVNGWTYDNAGNTLNDGRHVYTWNALNQQTTMDGTAAQYRYDAQGSRVMKITPTKTTYYVFGMGEYSGGVWEKLYVSLNGQKLIEYSNGTTYFFHSDHLGTPRVQTSVSGAVVETWAAYPFGEQWTMTGGVGNKHRYTGKERDPESANDYFGARYYWNGAARWLSVDPEKVVTDPQQLNGYNYVRNDPVNFMDRDGRNLGRVCESGECMGDDGYFLWDYGTTTYPNDEFIEGAFHWGGRQGGGGGGGGTGATNPPPMNTAQDVLNGPCGNFFNQLFQANSQNPLFKGKSFEGLQAAAAQMKFYDMGNPSDQAVTLSSLSRSLSGVPGTLFDYFLRHLPPANETVFAMHPNWITQGRGRHRINLPVSLLAPGLSSVVPEEGTIRLEETLHYYFGVSDMDLRTNVLGVLPGLGNDSMQIQEFLRSNCDPKHLRP